ncbi:MAG: hypothetical protein Q8P20_10345 [bacterium]|nr:hypothetical protein [bacterium]
MKSQFLVLTSLFISIVFFSVFIIFNNVSDISLVNLFFELLITFIAVFAAFWLNTWREGNKEKQQFNSMIDLINAELKNNTSCLDMDAYPAISFETFKSMSSNSIFIKYISHDGFNTLWKTYSSLRIFKNNKEKRSDTDDKLLKLWFNGEIDATPILKLVIKKIEAEKK